MASFRMILTKNPSDAFDTADDFSGSVLSSYWTSAPGWGTAVTPSGGALTISTPNSEAVVYDKTQLRTDVEITMKFTYGPGGPGGSASNRVGGVIGLQDGNNFLMLDLREDNNLRIIKIENGGQVGLAIQALGVALGANTSYWLRCKRIKKVVSIELFASSPLEGGSASVVSTSYTLTDTESVTFDSGYAGFNWDASQSSQRIDDVRIHPLGIDLARFTRVSQGEGLDPANSEFIEPSFAESPLRDGGPLINIDAKNREMHVPMHVSGTSKDDLMKKMAAINRAMQEPGVQIEWRDDGSTRSTFLDMQAGRLDQEYNFRRAQRFWGSCTAVLWTTPYGHTNVTRVIGTLSASGAVQGMPVEPQSNDPSNMISSGDFELGVLGLGSWSVAAGFGINGGGSIMQTQTIPTTSPAFVGDYVMRVFADGTVFAEGARVAIPVFASNAASQIGAIARIRTPRAASYPMKMMLVEMAGGGAIQVQAPLVVGTTWTTASALFALSAASLSGSWGLVIRCEPTNIASVTFEIDQVVVTMNTPPSLSIPSILDGDAGAKAVWQVTTGSQVLDNALQLGRYIGVAALPASYVHYWGAGSIQSPTGAIIAASGAQGSQVYSPSIIATLAVDQSYGRLAISAPAYTGRNRVYAIGRSRTEANSAIWLRDWQGQRVGPTAIASGTRDMHLYDLGVLSVPTVGAPSLLGLDVIGNQWIQTSASFYGGPPGHMASIQSPELFHLNSVVILPEDKSALLVDDYDVPSQIVYDSLLVLPSPGGNLNTLLGHTGETGHTWASSFVASYLGVVGPSAIVAVPYEGGLIDFGNASDMHAQVRIPSMLLGDCRLTAGMYRISPGTPSEAIRIGKEIGSAAFYGARYSSGTNPCFSIEWTETGGANATYIGSMAVGASVPNPARLKIVCDFLGATMSAKLIWDEPVASQAVLATAALSIASGIPHNGDPQLHVRSSASSLPGANHNQVFDFRVESVPTQRIAARDVYVLDGVAGEAYRSPAGGDIQQRLTHKLRGQIPRVPVPSTARLVAFALGLPEGVASDLTDVQVSIREQFHFAR